MEEVELIEEDTLFMLFDDVGWIQFSGYLLSLCASFLLERMESWAEPRRNLGT